MTYKNPVARTLYEYKQFPTYKWIVNRKFVSQLFVTWKAFAY